MNSYFISFDDDPSNYVFLKARSASQAKYRFWLERFSEFISYEEFIFDKTFKLNIHKVRENN